jgi:molecular chaperone Hsp33
MSNTDHLHKFLFDNCDIRGEIVSLKQAYRQVMENNPYPPSMQKLLGEFLAIVGLLSSTLKMDGKIIVQAHGNGPVSTVMAECTHHNEVRGIIRQNPDIELTDEITLAANLRELLGQGVIVITLEPKRAENFAGKLERYQGIVPMEADNLAACIEHYFEQSEQLATRIWLTVNSQSAHGLMLQALPQQIASAEVNVENWETLVTLATTLKPAEVLQLNHLDILYRLFHEQELRVYEPRELHFACSCSEERCIQALVALGKDELEDILTEKGSVDMDCQFCNQHYHFSAEKVRQLYQGSILH